MNWTDEAIVLRVRPHGETSAILDVLSQNRGRHAGLVHGGVSRTKRPLLQPGNTLRVEWKARLEEQLGHFTIEPETLRAATVMQDRLSLSGLNAACGLALEVLPEREPVPAVFAAMTVLLDTLSEPDIWPALYVRWEMGLLEALGYGIDLSKCASTGANDNLTHVSPRSGRAVSASAAEPYLDKLLPLPPFLLGEPIITPKTLREGLDLTGYFLETRVQWNINRTLPESRSHMIARLVDTGLADPA